MNDNYLWHRAVRQTIRSHPKEAEEKRGHVKDAI